MDKTNMDGFKKTCFGKTIEADGQIICGKPSINLSSILTVLIQEAGRWCRSYASDLFIYWSSLQKQSPGSELSAMLVFSTSSAACFIWETVTPSMFITMHMELLWDV